MHLPVVAHQRDAKAAPLNSRWQLSRIFSNTGCASATELLMTCSTSAVAVCRSSASCVSLNRRTFSIAITAWSTKACISAICLALNSPGSLRATPNAPMHSSPCMIGSISDERKPSAA